MSAIPVPPNASAKRMEVRTPLEVVVDLASVDVRMPAQEGVTVNVSARGACVLSTRPWKINDKMVIATITGSFKSVARVAYCAVTPESQFAVGLEFLEQNGRWVVDRAGALAVC